MAVKQKIKSSHDVLDDPRLLKEHNLTEEMVIVYPVIFLSCELVYIHLNVLDGLISLPFEEIKLFIELSSPALIVVSPNASFSLLILRHMESVDK